MTTKRKELMQAVPRRELDVFDEMDRMFDTFFHRGWLRPFRELWPEWGRLEEGFEVVAPRVDLIDREGDF